MSCTSMQVRGAARGALFALTLLFAFQAPAWSPLAAQDAEAADDEKKDKKKDPPLPLEAAREVQFSTDEGSWISLDVSPDGSTIVFDLLGDLYTLPMEGGTATQLTSGMAFDEQPRYSPDGTEILFVSDRSGGDNLWTIDVATGDTTQLTKGNDRNYMSPAWTPDGQYVVASRGESRLGVVQLWLGHVDGGSGQTLLGEPDNLKTAGAAVTPDGRQIWFARRQDSWDYNAALPQYQLAYYDRETGDVFGRTSRYGSGFRPTISPDGRWLVYGTRHEDETGLMKRDLRTGDESWLAYPVQRDDQESIADRDVMPGMAFTPDSREVVASYGGKIWRVPLDGSPHIPVPFTVDVDLDIGPPLFFDYPIDDSPTFTAREIRDASPSPDGSRLAFSALGRLYVLDWPDGEPRRLTDADHVEAQPTWSPDGRWLAYVTWEDDGGHIRKVRSDGRGDTRLTDTPATYQRPAWSPAGDRLVAIRGPARAYREATGPFAPGASEDLVSVAADPSGGPAPAQLIAPAEGRGAPHFGGSADRIYLTRGGTLLSIRWDGTDEKEHLRVTGSKRPRADQPNNASLILMAPVGDQAIAQVNDHIYTVTVPFVGGETPSVSISNPDNAPFPAKRLTEVGGQFPAWGADGRAVHWSIGNAHVVYDLDRAEAFADSVAEAKKQAAEEEEAEEEGEGDADDEAEGEDEAEEEDEEPEYEPVLRRVAVTASRDLPAGDAVLRGARIITMEGDQVIEGGDVLVRGNRIAAVGAAGEVEVPAGAEVIDVSGMTIVPGFVDTHAHIRPAFGLHKNEAWAFLANLAYGVTTVRDPQTSTTDILTYGDLVETGDMIGPRIYSTGPGVFGNYVEDPIKDLDDAKKLLTQYSEFFDTKTIKMYMAGNRQQRQWVAMASKEHELMPTTEGGLMFGYNITMMIDGYAGQEHSFPIYPVYRDVIELAARSGIFYTPTLLVSYGGPFGENYFYAKENPHDDPKLARFTPHSVLDRSTRRRNAGWFRDEEYVFSDHGVGVRAIVDAGGKVGVGSHGQLQGLGYHWELWAVASGGLSEHDALRAATIFGAEAIGLEGDVGTLSGGKLADLVVLSGNPLDDIRNTNTVRYVMKNGRLYDGDTLDEIWPRQIQRAAGSWVADEPETAAGIRPDVTASGDRPLAEEEAGSR
ncbi:MAG: amidohydrolase family protein [Gemmatimonadota bacterium]